MSCANGGRFGATCTKGRQPVCFTINWRTLELFVKHTYPLFPIHSYPQPSPPLPPPHFLDRSAAPVIEAVQDVVESLFDLRNEYIEFPETEQETAALIRTFEEYSDLPNIAGAIDGTHIRIEAPKDSAVDYFSRYQQHDFVVQAVVDSRAEQFLLIDHRMNRKTDDRPFLARFLPGLSHAYVNCSFTVD